VPWATTETGWLPRTYSRGTDVLAQSSVLRLFRRRLRAQFALTRRNPGEPTHDAPVAA
jgi:hypothetical protein